MAKSKFLFKEGWTDGQFVPNKQDVVNLINQEDSSLTIVQRECYENDDEVYVIKLKFKHSKSDIERPNPK